MKLKILIIFLALQGICLATLPQPKIYSDGVCNFKLYGYEMTPPVQNAILFGVDRILTTYKDEFSLPYKDDFRVNVIIIKDQDHFLEFQKQHIGKVISTSGYYSGSKKETVVWADNNIEEMLDTLFHEASHMILRNQVPSIPVWANEGLAVYFGGLNVIGKKKRINLSQNRHSWMKHWAENGMPIPLDVYLALDHKSWMALRKKDSNVAYTIGYEVVYFMMSNSRNQNMFGQIINQYKIKGEQAKATEMIDEYYKGGFEKFQEHWFKWIPKARNSRPLRALKKKPSSAKTENANEN